MNNGRELRSWLTQDTQARLHHHTGAAPPAAAPGTGAVSSSRRPLSVIEQRALSESEGSRGIRPNADPESQLRRGF